MGKVLVNESPNLCLFLLELLAGLPFRYYPVRNFVDALRGPGLVLEEIALQSGDLVKTGQLPLQSRQSIAYTKLVLGDCLGKSLCQLRDLVFSEQRDGMGGCLALGKRKVLLGRILY